MPERSEKIREAFSEGREYTFAWGNTERVALDSLATLSRFLRTLPHELSYPGTDNRTAYRRSCWVASRAIDEPFLTSRRAIETFDGDIAAGRAGLELLKKPEAAKAMNEIKAFIDDALFETARAVKIGGNILNKCSVRYRVIEYEEHEETPGGIGLHPDGNALSALITDAPGLNVYHLDGTLRQPSYHGTIVMPGSTLYRWSNHTYLPTFHDVDVRGGQHKTSVVGFFNFPDQTEIPYSQHAEDGTFTHDIRSIKEDDRKPNGELKPLWDAVAAAYGLSLSP